jgi:hypothetical protein
MQVGFELLEVPEGYETDLALVIAPYFDPRFAKRLIKELSPNRVRFVVDDGARPEDIDQLLKACGKTDVKVALAGAAGIVHIKGFYFEFVKAEGRQRRKRRFLFGSANATEAAFSGKINAELIADVDLTAGNDAELLVYLEAVRDAIDGEGGGRIKAASFGPLQHPPTLHMPSFKIFPWLTEARAFDTWLQRGLLAAKYRDAQQFLNVRVKLKSALPKDLVAEIFADQGLVDLEARNAVRFPYIGQLPLEENDDSIASQWKSQYCVWTHLGEWMSSQCHSTIGHTLRAKSSPAREAKVNELLDHADDKKWKSSRRQVFLGALDQTWQRLMAAEINPADYLFSDGKGIDRAAFTKKFDDKIKADLCLAADEDFRSRYVDGYEFAKLPRFRQDTAAWNSFVRSWGESIAVEAAKPNTRCKAAKIITSVFDAMGLDIAEMDADDITGKLSKSWEKTVSVADEKKTLGEFVSCYFQPPQK